MRGNAYIDFSLFVDDVNVPIAHRLFDRDRLPSPAMRQAQDKLTSGLAEIGESGIKDGQTSFARPMAGSGQAHNRFSLKPGDQKF